MRPIGPIRPIRRMRRAGAHPYLEQRRFWFGDDALMPQQMVSDLVVQLLYSIQQVTNDRDYLIALHYLFRFLTLRDEKRIPIEPADLLNDSVQIGQSRF